MTINHQWQLVQRPSGEASTTVEAGNRLRLSPAGVVLTLLRLSSADYTGILGGPLFSGFSSPLPGFAALESYLRSAVPGAYLPSLPALPSAPAMPGLPSIPRFGLF